MSALARQCPATITEPAYEGMLAAIEKCVRIDEVKYYQDRAAALEAYHRQAHNLEAEKKCALIRIRAAHRCGELLRETAETGERATRGSAGGRGDRKSPEGTFKLADYGISPKQSSEWQELALTPWEKLEGLVSSNVDKVMSIGGLLRQAQKKTIPWNDIPLVNHACWKCRHTWDGQEDICPACGWNQTEYFDRYIRMAQLFFNGPGWREFCELEATLRKRYGTKNQTQTVVEALRREVAAGTGGVSE